MSETEGKKRIIVALVEIVISFSAQSCSIGAHALPAAQRWRTMRDNFSISPLFSSAKYSAFGGDFAPCFSIALSLDADTYSFG
ncbi:MAG: hypothetical protein IM571_02245 [Chitinophagaceae bacterium]|jgi:hypothetical protein|nr:hypothetical protein [Chitinophagaceae bacterium]MCA6469124.1 hypothetical protein [Chitinophagaceae bacterium]MCA6476750.1 hypothetical protein [Chitinophagaceae bacterium]MCA6497102.1 hypothetical protein [Chitinophagaceae bacterium]MCA6511540.1 hypothetical protein [Chitinophagaceae bacterium]